MEKEFQYASKIESHLLEMLTNKDCEYYINPEEFLDSDKANAFFHALATLAPASIYNRLTEEESNSNALEFNYMANRLIFQFCQINEETK